MTIANSIFNQNSAIATGGAIRDNDGDLRIVNSSFSGNTDTGTSANNGGGAIFLGTVATTATITDSSFTKNIAASDGGAIIDRGSLTITSGITSGGNTVFSGNQAGGLGGAIFLNNVAASLTLNATGGNITFSDNIMNTSSTAQANAIFINTGSVIFNADAGVITFFDPIASNAASGPISVTKTGPGIVSFDGSQRANNSAIYANTVVEGGTFEIRNNAVYGVRAADVGGSAPSSFTVGPGATLLGGAAGKVRVDEFTLDGTLDLGTNFTVDSPSLTINGGTIRTLPIPPFPIPPRSIHSALLSILMVLTPPFREPTRAQGVSPKSAPALSF